MTANGPRVALVTGAARGLGAAVVRRLTRDGCRVVALDWCAGPEAEPYPMPTEADLESVCRTAGGDRTAIPVVADTRDRAALKEAVSAAVDRWGRLDVAVAGAALVAGGRPQWESPTDELELLWRVNTVGVWNTAQVCLPVMLAGDAPSGCRFVAIASAAGSHGLYGLAAYTMVKHAVVGLVRALAADLVGTGVTAVAVSPGSMRTDMLDRTAELYSVPVDALISQQSLRRVIEPSELAEVVGFCCRPEGAVLNGSVVAADGGFRR